MWDIIGWVIWGILTFLGIWGIFVNRRHVKSGRDFNFTGGMVIVFEWIFIVLFLVFDWNKLHIVWSIPITIFSVPFLVTQKIPFLSHIFIWITRVFWATALMGAPARTYQERQIEDREEEMEEEDNEEEDNEEEEYHVVEQSRLDRYKRIRALGRELTNQMMEHIPRFVTMQAAKSLDLVGPKGVLVFDSEAEATYLMDRCFYDIKWDGKNLIDHFRESPDYQRLTKEEQAIVEGMTTAYYSLFEVLRVDPSQGALEVRDLLGESTYTIIDINSSRTATTGYLLAGRIKQVEGIYMTTGAICPFYVEHKANLLAGLEPKRIRGRRKAKRIQRSDYSAYFFKKHRRIKEIQFMSMEEME